jgi:hypothetical protein
VEIGTVRRKQNGGLSVKVDEVGRNVYKIPARVATHAHHSLDCRKRRKRRGQGLLVSSKRRHKSDRQQIADSREADSKGGWN